MLNTPFQGILVKKVMLGEKMFSDNMVENKTYYKVKQEKAIEGPLHRGQDQQTIKEAFLKEQPS